MSSDVRFKNPFTCIIAGPTRSGKSTFCVRFLQNLRTLCSESNFEGGILWWFSEQTSISRESLNELKPIIGYHEGVPIDIKKPRAQACLFILHDPLNDVYSSRNVCDLFTKSSHHRNISFILITQNIFHQDRHYRDISLNARYLLLLKNVRDRSQFYRLAQQV